MAKPTETYAKRPYFPDTTRIPEAVAKANLHHDVVMLMDSKTEERVGAVDSLALNLWTGFPASEPCKTGVFLTVDEARSLGVNMAPMEESDREAEEVMAENRARFARQDEAAEAYGWA